MQILPGACVAKRDNMSEWGVVFCAPINNQIVVYFKNAVVRMSMQQLKSEGWVVTNNHGNSWMDADGNIVS